MSELIVFALKNEADAGKMRDKLVSLQKQQLLALDNAAVLVRKQDGKVKVREAVSLVGTGEFGGACWRMLIGPLFLALWLGFAIGAAAGALGGALSD
jgi:uncharacterized membrane protein